MEVHPEEGTMVWSLTKAALKKTLGKAHISLTLLYTLVVEVEATLHDRPLTFISDDPRDPEPLTPLYLLYGTMVPYRKVTEEDLQYPDYKDSDNQICRNSKGLFLLLTHFQVWWKHEYLTSLKDFHKTSKTNKQVIKKSNVIVHNKTPRLCWKLAMIKDLVEGNDGLVRSALIRTTNGRTSRLIVKLYPLEVTSRSGDELSTTQTTICHCSKNNYTDDVNNTSTVSTRLPSSSSCSTCMRRHAATRALKISE